MNFETDELDEIADQFSELSDSATELDSEYDVPLAELFPDSFISSHTDFKTIDAFFETSPWEIEDQESLNKVPESELDEYVDERTEFHDWNHMYAIAGKKWVFDKLEL
jgi:hypothetical protein